MFISQLCICLGGVAPHRAVGLLQVVVGFDLHLMIVHLPVGSLMSHLMSHLMIVRLPVTDLTGRLVNQTHRFQFGQSTMWPKR